MLDKGFCFVLFFFFCVLDNQLSTLLFFFFWCEGRRSRDIQDTYTYIRVKPNNSVISVAHWKLSMFWPQVQDIPFSLTCDHWLTVVRERSQGLVSDRALF